MITKLHSQILEDNLVNQFGKQNLTVYQTGDFIWHYLLGNDSFSESRPYDSLDINDFDYVDHGASKDMLEFIERQDWSVLIGNSSL